MAQLDILAVSLIASALSLPAGLLGETPAAKPEPRPEASLAEREIWRLDRAVTRWEERCQAATVRAAGDAEVLARDARRMVAAFSGLERNAAKASLGERPLLRRKLASLGARLEPLSAFEPASGLARCAAALRSPEPATPGPRIVGVESACGSAIEVGEETVAWQFPSPAGGEPIAANSGEAWLRLDPAHDGRFSAHTRGSRADTEIAVFATCAEGTPQIASNDDLFGLQSGVGFHGTVGDSRWLRVRQRTGAAADPIFLTVLGEAGGISGVVTESGTGAPISNVRVSIYLRFTGNYVGGDYANGSGAYLVEGLDAGIYVARTDNAEDHLDELWDDRPCPENCDVTMGDPIIVLTNEVTSGIDFALLRAGAVSGRLRDLETGEAIPNFSVRIVDAAGSWTGSAETDAAGRYTVGGLDPGLHFAYTDGYEYRNEVYDDIPCVPFCDPQNGTPIQVVAEETTRNIDFELQALGSVSGTVIDAANGRPISFLRLSFYDVTGNWVGAAYTDEAGRYLGGGLDQGSHFVVTDTYTRYRNEVYDDLPCPGQGSGNCDPLTGTAVPVILGETTAGIDFALDRLGFLTGQVVDALSASPIPFVEVTAWADNGDFAGREYANALGTYLVEDLGAGTYFATTENDDGYLDELYDDLPCVGEFNPACDPTNGSPIAVALGGVTAGIDFALALGGVVTGKLTDAFTGEPLESKRVYLWSAAGTAAGDYWTDAAGDYTIGSLPTGTYFASSATFSDYLDELYDDVPCPGGVPGGCDPTTGTPIAVVEGMTTTGIDMDLVLRGGLAGVVTAASSGLPVAGVAIDVWDDGGNHVAAAATSISGAFQVDLTSGLYLVSTDTGQGYVDEIYDDVPCPAGPAVLGLCDPLDGDPVLVIGADPVVLGIDFALALPIFADGFESGDTSAWSVTVP